MKKVILSLIAIILFSFNTFATNLTGVFSAQVNINSTENFENQEIKSNVSIGFNSIQSFNVFNFNELNYNQINAESLKCDVSVTVSVGVVSVTVTAKDIDCSLVGETIARLKKLALSML